MDTMFAISMSQGPKDKKLEFHPFDSKWWASPQS